MAKRPTSRSKVTDPAQPKPKRARSTAADKSASAATGEPAAPDPAAEPSADDIRRRAYERYKERGGKHGQHFDDWFEAERELRIKK